MGRGGGGGENRRGLLTRQKEGGQERGIGRRGDG